MAETGSSSPESRLFNVPKHLGAMLEGGKNTGIALDPYTGEYLMDVYKVHKKPELKKWMFKNLNVFSDGTVSALELPRWRLYIDDWISDLRSAEKYARRKTTEDEDQALSKLSANFEKRGVILTTDQKKYYKKNIGAQKKEITEGMENFNREKEETKLKAMMAISASARGMEVSAATPAKYVAFMTGGDLDNAGTWSDYLLHKDEKKLEIVLNDPLVRYYYMRLLKDAGYSTVVKDDKNKKNINLSRLTGEGDNLDVANKLTYKELNKIALPDKSEIEKIRNGPLVKYLIEKKDEEVWGLDRYISDVLLDNKDIFNIENKGKNGEENPNKIEDIDVRRAAARLACDAFLVDKYTSWEYLVAGVWKVDKARDEEEETNEPDIKKLLFTPAESWDGNPFLSLLKPSLLPGDIKKMYSEEHSDILRMIDLTFHPVDIFDADPAHGGVAGTKAQELAPSAIVDLKQFSRLTSAMWLFFGEDSRAVGLPQWGDDAVKQIIKIGELVDTVYGALKNDNGDRVGKEIVAEIISRAIMCKTMAAVVETSSPSALSKGQMLFGVEEARPFDKIRKIIWGTNLNFNNGILAAMAGGRTQLNFTSKLGNSQLRPEVLLRKADELLITNDQNQQGRSNMIVASYAKVGLDLLAAGAEVFGKRR